MESLKFKFSVVLVVGLLLVVVESATTRVKRELCSPSMECLAPFPMLRGLVEKSDAKGLYALSYGGLLDHMCSKKAALHSCLDRTHCRYIQQLYVSEGVQASLDYICGDGRERLLSESKCFSRDSFEQAFKLCHATIEAEFKTMALSVGRGWERSTAYCTPINDFLKCVNHEVKNVCSEAAGEFMSHLATKIMHYTINQVGCQILNQ